MAKTLLVVHHTPSPTTRELLEAVLAGANDPEIDGVDVVSAEDVPDVPDGASGVPVPTRAEQQLAILAVRLEMAAVYLRLVRG